MSPPPSQPTSRWPVRPLTDDDWDEFVALDSHAFGSTMPEEAITADRALHRGARSIGVHDGTTLAGIATAYSYDISVPGGSSPAAAITWVGVLPTHRRQGVLRALMTSQLRSVHEAGREPLAILWASEPQIYGRFGYGLATRGLSMTVPRDPRALLTTVVSDPSLRLRLVDAADWKITAGVYDAVASVRPGMPARDELWWGQAVQDIPGMREGRSELRCVVAEDDGGVRAYARYRTKQSFDDGFGSGVVSVREVMGVDPAALASLYRYLFDLDLMGSTELWHRPVDDPLMSWLQNTRRAKPILGDALYVRLVDLDRALRGRSYATAVDAVLEVSDEICPWNAGRWRLTGGPDGSTCERTEDPADIALAVVDLGAVYLGGTTLTELALAGRVEERQPGSVAAAATAFAHSPAPWCPAVF
ncbi:MAG: GNAT family N-acetyltransferase [Spirochaetaceae bacterium]|nr:GNAT family N-acetyltransferase [Spirochaetaceae bacterium]